MKKTKSCAFCSESFVSFVSQKKKYCTRMCYWKDMKVRGIQPPSQEGIGGELHWNWQGGKTSLHKKIRDSTQYKNWRKSVFERDNYTCKICGQRGGKLNADHIKPFYKFPKLRLSLNNGRTLCIECHKKHGDGYGKKYPHSKRDGKKGGDMIKNKYGKDYYKKISNKRWDKKRGATVHIPILV